MKVKPFGLGGFRDYISKEYQNLRARNLREGSLLNPDGTRSTVRMAYGTTDNGFAVHPTLFQNSEGEFYESDNPFQEAKDRGEIFLFASEQEAADFAGGSWKLDTMKKKDKYLDGGTVSGIGSAVSQVGGMIPGPWGAAIGGIGTLANVAGGIIDMVKAGRPSMDKASPLTQSNPFGSNFAFGGRYTEDTNGLRRFHGDKHSEGGVPFRGVEVEGEETAYEDYVFSERLGYGGRIGDKDKSFADMSKEISAKYENADRDPIQRRTMKLQMARLMKANDVVRSKTSTAEFGDGGQIDLAELDLQANPWSVGATSMPTFRPPGQAPQFAVAPTSPTRPSAAGNAMPIDDTPLTGDPQIELPNNPNSFSRLNEPIVPFDRDNLNAPVSSEPKDLRLTTGDKMQLGAGALAAGYNLINALRPAEKFKPITNPYENVALRKLEGRTATLQGSINEANLSENAARESIFENTRGGAAMSNLQNLAANSARTRAGIKQQEVQLQNELDTSFASAASNLGAQRAAAGERARGYEVQSKNAKQLAGTAAATTIAQTLSNTGKALNHRQLRNQLAGLAKTNDFSYNSETGEIDFNGMKFANAESFKDYLTGLGIIDPGTNKVAQ